MKETRRKQSEYKKSVRSVA